MTAAFALAMALVIAATGMFVYLRLHDDLTDSLEAGLSSRSDDVAELIRRSGTGFAKATGGRLAEPNEVFVQVLTPDGRLLEGTSRVRAAALDPAQTRRAARAPTFHEREVPGVDGTTRMLARPVIAQGRSLVVVAGASLEDRDEALSALLAAFLIGGPIAVLIASAIGYLLAGAGLAPVEAMRRRATQVSFTREGERLPLPVARDEVRRLGETLNEMLGRLEASFQRERQFVADASHELRTPLAVLKAELEAALRAGPGANVRESLVAALEETDQLAQLADDLLLIARAADGRMPVRPEEVEVGELLERTRERFVDRAREQGRAISVHAPGDLRASLDPLRGRQALGNLVDNALRHGDGVISLAARREREAVEIDVTDEGPGFSPELAPRAFERFARGDLARTGSGAGLGLAIVRAITEAHAGTATIVDTGARGASVRLRFPLAASPRERRSRLSAPSQLRVEA